MAASPDHGKLDESLQGIHRAYQWSYADAAARTGAGGFVSTDVGKFARQLDNNTIWLLTAVTPTWVQVGNAGTVTSVTGTPPIASSGGATPAISISDFVASGGSHARGSVPDPGASGGTTKFLREDASWQVPPGTSSAIPSGTIMLISQVFG